MKGRSDRGKPLLAARGISVDYAARYHVGGAASRPVRAVNAVDIEIFHGETVALVGESGCGKSTLGRALALLHKATEGRVLFQGEDVTTEGGRALRRRRRDIQMVFQDPNGSLNPRMRIGSAIMERARVAGVASKAEAVERTRRVLESVGFDASYMTRYPKELSGGQRQRVSIARALVMQPKVIICDEPVASLDVSIQAQIVQLLKDLQAEHGFSYLFISHDLGMVRALADRVCVMYLGRIVESGRTDDVVLQPSHPYTQALLDAAPVPDPRWERSRQYSSLAGEVPSIRNPPPGCPFHPRCEYATDICRSALPAIQEVADNHCTRCHHWSIVRGVSERR